MSSLVDVMAFIGFVFLSIYWGVCLPIWFYNCVRHDGPAPLFSFWSFMLVCIAALVYRVVV